MRICPLPGKAGRPLVEVVMACLVSYPPRRRGLLQRGEAGLEEPEVAGLVGHGEPRGVVPARVGRRYRLGDDVHVRLGVDAARDRQPGQLEAGVTVFPGLRVAAGGHDAALHAPDPGFEVKLGGEGLRRELLLVQVWVEAARV